MVQKQKCSPLATGQKHCGWQKRRLACSILPILSGQMTVSKPVSVLPCTQETGPRHRWQKAPHIVWEEGISSLALQLPGWDWCKRGLSHGVWQRLQLFPLAPAVPLIPSTQCSTPKGRADPSQGGDPPRSCLQPPCPAFLGQPWFNVTSRRCHKTTFIHNLVIADDLMRA